MPREVLTKCRINVKLGGINTIPDPQSTSQKEIIEDLGEMAQHIRICGVSEGQFQEVLDFELKALQVYFRADWPPIAGLCFMSCLCEVNSLCINSGTCLLYCLHRAKNHYDPQGGINLSDMATHTDNTGAESALEAYKHNFKPLHNNMTTLMYFS
ncbi:hypothetical protein EDC04DRAFT_3093715 [Pisolithus marmoratus]|nr:hypothetical protein EDC04DRAFT_3093715 [Pisolithus marmoratus]